MGRRLNRITCGDFNSPSWREGFEESLGEAGIPGLSDPNIPNSPSGNAPGRSLLIFGEDPWEAFLPDPMGSTEEPGDCLLEDKYFPAVAVAQHPLSAHHTVHLELPFVEEQEQPRARTLMVDNRSPDEWGDRNVRMKETLKGRHPVFEDARKRNGINRMYQHIIGLTVEGLLGGYSRAARSPVRRDPMELFRRTNASHPKIKYLKVGMRSLQTHQRDLRTLLGRPP